MPPAQRLQPPHELCHLRAFLRPDTRIDERRASSGCQSEARSASAGMQARVRSPLNEGRFSITSWVGRGPGRAAMMPSHQRPRLAVPRYDTLFATCAAAAFPAAAIQDLKTALKTVRLRCRTHAAVATRPHCRAPPPFAPAPTCGHNRGGYCEVSCGDCRANSTFSWHLNLYEDILELALKREWLPT